MTKYIELTREELNAFDKESTSLVLEAGQYGWLGRISSKGHAIMRAPDGSSTMSITRDSLRGRSGRNARAYFDRWLKTQEKEEEMTEKPAPLPRYLCAECGRRFDSSHSLGSHRRKHTLSKKDYQDCPVCGRRRKVLTYHMRKDHGPKVRDLYNKGGLEAVRYWLSTSDEQVESQPDPQPVDNQEEEASVQSPVAVQVIHEVIDERDRLRRENEDLRARLDLAREALGL